MKQILIIDDESQIRSMLKKLMEREGFDIIVASNGKEGMKLFNEKKIDLVITDIVMPEKEGIEIIQELKKKDSNFPIIAISGGGKCSPDTYLNMAKLFGANAVFEKPVAKDELINTVKKILKIK